MRIGRGRREPSALLPHRRNVALSIQGGFSNHLNPAGRRGFPLYKVRPGLKNIRFDRERSGNSGRGLEVHEEAIRKADVLIEALGYIRKFHGRFTVIKLGGSVMEDPEALRALLVDIVFMQTVGMRPVVIHGGGKAITFAMEKAGLEARFVQGRRYTDNATLEIVARVLAEEINADIWRHITKYGGRAAGLHHKTSQCLFGRRITLPDGQGGAIDLG